MDSRYLIDSRRSTVDGGRAGGGLKIAGSVCPSDWREEEGIGGRREGIRGDLKRNQT